jgi:hypothetical protein
VVWSDGDPRTEVGARDWVVAAKQHGILLQEIRGTGPLVSGLMGMDICVGCCQMKYTSGSQPRKLRTTPSS